MKGLPIQSSNSTQSSDDLPNVIKINEGQFKNHLGQMVRSTVEETLNAMLDAEADQLCQAQKYQRTSKRVNSRSGHYTRSLNITSGEVELKVTKLRGAKIETAIIERYRRRESSVEEALIEMYLAGVSVRRVEDITQTTQPPRVPTV